MIAPRLSAPVLYLLAIAGSACASLPRGPQPFDTVDPIPEELLPQPVDQGTFGQLLRERVNGMSDSEADRTASEVFARPAGPVVTVHNQELRFDAVISSSGPTRYAILLRTSDQGFPIIPIERIATAVSIEGITARAQYDFSKSMAQCLAANGLCAALVAFDNGNGFETTFSVERERPAFLLTRIRFLPAGSFSRGDYALVIAAGSGSVVTSGRGNTAVKKIPLLDPPRPSPSFGPRPQGRRSVRNLERAPS